MASKKRKTKDLPECLLYLTQNNFRTQLRARLEADAKDQSGEVMVAFEVKLVGEEGDATFDLQKLNLDQIRKLCRNVGVQYVNKCNKFQCRKALCCQHFRDESGKSRLVKQFTSIHRQVES